MSKHPISSRGGQPEQTPVHPSKPQRLLRGSNPKLMSQAELGAPLFFPGLWHVPGKAKDSDTVLCLPGSWWSGLFLILQQPTQGLAWGGL